MIKQTSRTVLKWHPTKNGELTINDVTTRSRKKVWWICELGHEWETTIWSVLTLGTGCPVCAGKKILKGYNDLATKNPELAKEWDYEKNDKTPDMVFPNTLKSAWWLCPKCGRSWKARIAGRNLGNGCVCTYKQRKMKNYRKNKIKTLGSLADNYPELVKEWHKEKNKPMTPHDVLASSAIKVWWFCPICGNEWSTYIRNRCTGAGCPKCGIAKMPKTKNETLLKRRGSLLTNNPTLADEWNYEKNGSLTPDKVLRGTAMSVWWLCRLCSNEWKAGIGYRSRGAGCAECARRLRTLQ
jgi:hypothetical protein